MKLVPTGMLNLRLDRGEEDSTWMEVEDNFTGSSSHVVNMSIRNQKFCIKWKIGMVIPLHKGGKLDKLNPEAYHQISILPIISKIAEKVVQAHISSYMEETGQYSRNLHVYRNLQSTTTAALHMSNYIAVAARSKLHHKCNVHRPISSF